MTATMKTEQCANGFTYPVEATSMISITTVGRQTYVKHYTTTCALPQCALHGWSRITREGEKTGICLHCAWEEDGGIVTVARGTVTVPAPAMLPANWGRATAKPKKRRARKIDRAARAAKDDKMQQTLMAFKGFSIN